MVESWLGRTFKIRGFLQVLKLACEDIFHGYFAVRLDSPPTGDEPALLLEGFLHVSNIPTNKVCCLTDFATAPSGYALKVSKNHFESWTVLLE